MTDIKPVLFLCFNRPAETVQSFECIRTAKPSKLYVSIDGPRNRAEHALCAEVEEIVRLVDWDCDVNYLINKENKGCKNAVNTALDWFFENEEMGIILEDDIVPIPAFFQFCSHCLDLYRYDKRIMLISGNNLLGEYDVNSSYFFSKVGAIWGWASWKRVWVTHDKDIKYWPVIKESKALFSILPAEMAIERQTLTDQAFLGKINTWDYQFTFFRMINSGMSIIPKRNMIRNIGFNQNATHTKSAPPHISNEPYELTDLNLTHPIAIYPDLDFDLRVFRQRNPCRPFGKLLRNILGQILRKLGLRNIVR